jgi:uncharacterized protein YneF (UPF0154 family)
MWAYIIPIVTLIIGLAGGFFIGIFYFKKQMEKMQNDPKMIQEMAKKMGYNVNKQQMNKMQQMMKNKKMR